MVIQTFTFIDYIIVQLSLLVLRQDESCPVDASMSMSGCDGREGTDGREDTHRSMRIAQPLPVVPLFCQFFFLATMFL